MDWNDLKFFLAVAQGKSLSAAAGQLGVSVSTVSRRIAALEQALDVVLFRPHRDGYDLTPAGEGLVPEAERASLHIRAFARSAQGREAGLAGPVRIEAPELLGQDVVLPALAALIAAHPGIEIELHGSVRPVRLAGEEADIILRLVRPERGNYRVRRLRQIGFGLYASADHVARNGVPQRAEDLLRQRVIGWPEEMHYLAMARWLAGLCPDLHPALRLSSLGAQLAAARLGLGWAVLPDFAAGPAGLVAALPDAPPLSPDLWLLVHQQRAEVPRVDLVRKALVAALA